MDISAVRPLLGFSLPCLFNAVTTLFNSRLDQVLIAGLLPARDLGLYATAFAWGSASLPITSALGTHLLPKLASFEPGPPRLVALRSGLQRAVLTAAGAGGLLLAATPVTFGMVFGNRFSAALPSAALLVIAGALQGYNLVVEDGLRGMGSPRLALYAEVAGSVVGAALLVIILPGGGIFGAAIATLIGSGVVTVVLVQQLVSRVEVSARHFLPCWETFASTYEDLQVVAVRIVSCR